MPFLIAWFELRQQLRGRVFWIVFAVSALMVAGAEAIDALRVGLGEAAGAEAVVRVHQVWTLFYLFTAAAFVADAVLRDDLTGMAGVVNATAASRTGYLTGRFLGGFAAVVLCFFSVPATLWASGLVKGVGAPLGAYLFAFFGLALPNLAIGSALCFGLATATRSLTGCLLGAVALLTLYGLGAESGALWEPFGFAAVEEVTLGWDAARLRRDWPGLEGVLLANRVIWLMAASAFVAAARLGLQRAGGAGRVSRRNGKDRLAADEGVSYAITRFDSSDSADPRFDGALVGAQLRMRTLLELRQIVLTPPFAVLVLLGLAHASVALWRAPDPTTAGLIRTLTEAFRLAPVVIAIFFAGELYWSERERRIDALIAASPVEAPMLVVPKLAGLALILMALAISTTAAGIGVELARGGSPDVGAWAGSYMLPRWFDWFLVGVLAIFLQSLSPNKLAGWGLTVFYLIGSMALDRLGWTEPLYRYGSYPGAPLPPLLSGAEGTGSYRVYWAVVAGLFAAVACSRSPVRSSVRS